MIPMYTFTKVDGEKRGDIVLYALSTCVWCKKTKQLLSDLKVEYNYIFVDQLDRKTRDEVEGDMIKWNPRCSFPTIVLNNQRCIVGYQEADIKEALGL
jgi:glutaredoxin